MSNLGAQAARSKREAETEIRVISKAPEKRWRGFVLYADASGTSRARVSIPESVLRQYVVELPNRPGIEAPNSRGVAIGMIENELGSDAFVEGRGWPK